MNILLKKYNKLIYVFAFVLTFIFAYAYLFIVEPLNSDTVGAYVVGSKANLSYKWSIANGRWSKGLLELLIEKLGYHNIVPVFLFLLLIVVCALFIFNLNDLFKFDNIYIGIFISVVFFLTPANVALFTFFNDTYAHVFAILLISIIIKKCFIDNNFIIYIVLLPIIIGFYQSYFCVVTSIYVIYLINQLLANKINDKNITKFLMDILRFIIFSFLSVIIYYILNRLCERVFSVEGVMSTRFVVDFSLSNIFKLILKMYGMVFILPFSNYGGLNTTLLSKCCYLVSYILVLYAIFQYIKKNKLHINLIIITLLISLPVFMNIIVFANNHVIIQMTQGLGLIYLFLAVILNYICSNKFFNLNKFMNNLINIVLVLLCVHAIYFATGYVHVSKIVSDSTFKYVNQLVTSIKTVNGYNQSTPIYFHGKISDNNLISYYSHFDGEVFPLAMPYNHLLFPWEYRETFNRYAAFNYQEANNESISNVINTDDFKNMNIYPNSNSIRIINDTLVVKFSE